MTIKERIYASRILEKAERNADYVETIGISYKLTPRKEQINGVMQSNSPFIDEAMDKPDDARI